MSGRYLSPNLWNYYLKSVYKNMITAGYVLFHKVLQIQDTYYERFLSTFVKCLIIYVTIITFLYLPYCPHHYYYKNNTNA